MTKHSEKVAWILVASGATMLATSVVGAIMTQGWKRWRETEPPRDVAARNADLNDALVWAIASGVAAGIASVLATRGAALTWHKTSGEWPPV